MPVLRRGGWAFSRIRLDMSALLGLQFNRASLSVFSLNSPSHGLTADGGAMQAHLHSGPDVIVSTLKKSCAVALPSSIRRQALLLRGLTTHLHRQSEPSERAFTLS
ncbi:hypothetical protein EYF80_020589 [Liparis tanakae]|uniref:Uncharacterized protein n=1 Tax=Liparis tanakae TaxID=230148 RepID=A0A4Z2HWK7_9TELE|nr:hypothetical protein EYF80_020589 [Liparis tanakae]